MIFGWWVQWRAPTTKLADTPLTIAVSSTEEWSPRNSDKAFMGSISLAVAMQNSRSVVSRGSFAKDFRLSVAVRDDRWPKQELAWGPIGFAEGGAGQLEFWLYSRRWRPVVCLNPGVN